MLRGDFLIEESMSLGCCVAMSTLLDLSDHQFLNIASENTGLGEPFSKSFSMFRCSHLSIKSDFKTFSGYLDLITFSGLPT